MSDSHKISLLDLQTTDLSQYGKKNLDLSRDVSRTTDSTYRKQLSESLSKKQSKPASENSREPESRSIDPYSDQNRTEKNNAESGVTSASQEGRISEKSQESEVRQEKNVSGDSESQGVELASQSSSTAQESDKANSSESIDSAEEKILSPQELNQSVQNKEPAYSLFDSTFAGQGEVGIEQDVTTEVGEVQPPANFQFVEEQRPVELDVQVTETRLDETIPIPEGLAELMKQQVGDASSAGTGQENQTSDSGVETQTQDSLLGRAVELASQQDDESHAVENESLLQTEEFSELKKTDGLNQAIQEYEQANSEETSGENDAALQSLIQQQSLHSRSKSESQNLGSSSTESENGEVVSDQESQQGASGTVVEHLSEQLADGQTELTEKHSQETKQVEQGAEEIGPTAVTQNPNIASHSVNQVQAEVTKTGPVVQETISAVESDSSVNQQVVSSQPTSTSSTQSNAPVTPTVDAKQVEQLVERIVSSVRQSQSIGQQLKIRLSPPELGTLQIEVSLKNGEYTAKLEVQNNQVQKVINDNIAQLRDALAKSGVAMDRIEVNINTDSSEDHHSSQSDAQSQTGSEFQSNQFSENSSDSEQGSEDRSSVEEAAPNEHEAEQDGPQVARSQGVAAENVEEIDVQI